MAYNTIDKVTALLLNMMNVLIRTRTTRGTTSTFWNRLLHMSHQTLHLPEQEHMFETQKSLIVRYPRDHHNVAREMSGIIILVDIQSHN